MANEKSSIAHERQKISLSDVLVQSEKFFPKESHRVLTTKIGYNLAILVMIYLVIVTIFILVDYYTHAPSMPDISGLTDTTLNNYKNLNEIASERSLKLFDQFVHKSFLPVFTAILGYIFGIRGVEKEAE